VTTIAAQGSAKSRRLRDAAQGSVDSLQQPDARWYRGNYLLAVAYATLAQLAERKDVRLELAKRGIDPENRAKTHVALVARAMEVQLLVLTRPQAKLTKLERALRDFLMTLEPTILLLFAGTVRRWGRPTAADSAVIEELQSAGRLVRFAGAWRFATSRKARSVVAPHPGRQQACEIVLGATSYDDDQVVDALVDYVQTLDLDYRARYNFACFLAGRGKSDDHARAFLYLESALKAAPADLKFWARKDPSLKPLQNDRDFKEGFEKLVAEEAAGQQLGMQ
jgi:hypothetical protein